MDKIIVPYVQDEEHNAPKYLRPQAYPQIHLNETWHKKGDAAYESNKG